MLQVSEAEERPVASPRSAEAKNSWRDLAAPALIYIVTRLIDVIFLSVGASRQTQVGNQAAYYAHDTIPAAPGYWGVMANWDGQWYKAIALDGYPAQLPMESGHVVHNAWAFYPLFPTLARALMRLTGLSFEVAGGLVSVVCGGVAVVLLYGLLRRRMSRFASAAVIAALCSYPTAPVLQVAYSESVTLLVLVLVLRALEGRKYGLFVGLAVVLALARPIAAPLAAVTLVHWLGRWRNEGIPRGPREWTMPTATLAVTAGSALLWPAVAWLATGQRRAFLMTEEAWTLVDGNSFFGRSVLAHALHSSWRVIVFLVVPALLCVLLAMRRRARFWGPEIRAWAIAYPLYIVIATQPTFSVMRYLMLALVPWWPLPEPREGSVQPDAYVRRRWLILGVIVTLGLVLQYYWVTTVFTIHADPAHQGFP